MKHAINWFEIPAKNFERACAFYSTLMGGEVTVMPHPEYKYGMLPADMQNGAIGGGIVEGPGFEPSDKGALIYLNGGDDLNIPLARVEAAGGQILLPKTSLGPNGFMAQFMDTEGNKMALHSLQ